MQQLSIYELCRVLLTIALQLLDLLEHLVQRVPIFDILFGVTIRQLLLLIEVIPYGPVKELRLGEHGVVCPTHGVSIPQRLLPRFSSLGLVTFLQNLLRYVHGPRYIHIRMLLLDCADHLDHGLL